jgi:ribosomal protein L7/L12
MFDLTTPGSAPEPTAEEVAGCMEEARACLDTPTCECDACALNAKRIARALAARDTRIAALGARVREVEGERNSVLSAAAARIAEVQGGYERLVALKCDAESALTTERATVAALRGELATLARERNDARSERDALALDLAREQRTSEKIGRIKALRIDLGLGLKEAKEMVESQSAGAAEVREGLATQLRAAEADRNRLAAEVGELRAKLADAERDRDTYDKKWGACVDELREARLELMNERGEGDPPDPRWEWIRGQWETREDAFGAWECVVSRHDDRWRFEWINHDPDAAEDQEWPDGHATHARSAMRAATKSLEGK